MIAASEEQLTQGLCSILTAKSIADLFGTDGPAYRRGRLQARGAFSDMGVVIKESDSAMRRLM